MRWNGTRDVRLPAPGTVIRREWRGEVYEVLIREKDFICRGRSYRSLSRIAEEIVGYAMNGFAFFNLKRPGGAAGGAVAVAEPPTAFQINLPPGVEVGFFPKVEQPPQERAVVKITGIETESGSAAPMAAPPDTFDAVKVVTDNMLSALKLESPSGVLDSENEFLDADAVQVEFIRRGDPRGLRDLPLGAEIPLTNDVVIRGFRFQGLIRIGDKNTRTGSIRIHAYIHRAPRDERELGFSRYERVTAWKPVDVNGEDVLRFERSCYIGVGAAAWNVEKTP